MTRLATFVQISDLHFGFPDQGPALDAEIDWDWRVLEVYDGFLGHHEIALAHLEEFYSALVDREQAMLIVTGDLTTVGHESQFEMADEYLRDELQPIRRSLGLHSSDWKSRSIPGNHDHWPGIRRFMLGSSTPHLERCFPWQPDGAETSGVLDLENGWSVRWVRIDTDADVPPVSRDRFFARGDFASTLDRAEEQLDATGKNLQEIRVLLLHHSPRVVGYRSAITDHSKARLESFMHRNRIHVCLCGHTHLPGFRIRTLGKNSSVLEACCGSTTQLDDFEEAWGGKQRPTWRPNSLIVHRIIEENGALSWKAVVCDRTESGFVERMMSERPDRKGECGPDRGEIVLALPPPA